MLNWLKQKINARSWMISHQGESVLELDQALMRYVRWPPANSQELVESVQEAAYCWCLHYLSRQSCSGQQLQQRLERRGMPDKWCGAVIERLQQEGYVDDHERANLLQQKLLAKGKSRYAIEQSLKNQGLDASFTEDCDTANAFMWLERWGKYQNLHIKPERYLQRLARRGFNVDAIYQAYRHWLMQHDRES